MPGRETEYSVAAGEEGIVMRSHKLRMPASVFAGALFVALTGCGGADAPAESSASFEVAGARAVVAAASACVPGVHDTHARFGCVTCHPCGGVYGFDTPYTFATEVGTTSAGGSINVGTGTTPTTCTVACHYPMGSPQTTIAWNAETPLACVACHAPAALPATHPAVSTDATRDDCQRCHDPAGHTTGTVTLVGHEPAWMDEASPQFHAYSANADFASCRVCHGQDLTGGAAGRACAECHDLNLPEGVASWKVNCTMCHGGTVNATGAPPKTTWGNDEDLIRVGAHTKHVTASTIAPEMGCAVCHKVPVDALSQDHVDGPTAEVTFSGIAAAGEPQWDRGSPSCAVYCHGATLRIGGGSNTAPSWTGGESQATCGTCHGLPPPPPHPAVYGLTTCGACHPDTVDSAGAILAPSAGGKHLDGIVEFTGGHTGGWMDEDSAEFHAFSANLGLDGCTACHGAELDGGMAQACGNCHNQNLPQGVTSWKTNCTMCHGGIDNPTGAPPKATWGNNAVAGASNIRIGVHTTHVTGTANSRAIGCEVCHEKPASALDAAHVDGSTATVTFSGIASQGKTPTWNRTTATCASTYCHSGQGAWTPTPVWTRSGSMTSCSACHRSPPTDTEHSNYHWGYPCGMCHVGYTSTSTVAATHVDGVKNVTNPVTGAPWTAGWTDCGPCHSYY